MSDTPIEGLMGTPLDKIKNMVDANTVIGTPITTSDGTTIIPVSKVSYGFGSGGSEFASKHQNSNNLFGGGAGAGVTVNPVAFLVVSNGDVKLLSVTQGSTEQAVALVPEMFDKIVGLFKKDKKDKKDKKIKEDKNSEDEEQGIDDPKI